MKFYKKITYDKNSLKLYCNNWFILQDKKINFLWFINDKELEEVIEKQETSCYLPNISKNTCS